MTNEDRLRTDNEHLRSEIEALRQELQRLSEIRSSTITSVTGILGYAKLIAMRQTEMNTISEIAHSIEREAVQILARITEIEDRSE